MSIGRLVHRTARQNEVAVFVLDHALVDPPLPHCARDLLGSDQCGRWILGRCNELAELRFVFVGVEWWKLDQVEEPLMADVLKGVDVDLI